MASEKIYDVVATTGTYTDRTTGREKNRYKTVGAIMEITPTNGGKYHILLLDKTFNPAGLADPQHESIILNLFKPQDRQQQQPPAAQQPPADPAYQASMAAQAPADQPLEGDGVTPRF